MSNIPAINQENLTVDVCRRVRCQISHERRNILRIPLRLASLRKNAALNHLFTHMTGDRFHHPSRSTWSNAVSRNPVLAQVLRKHLRETAYP